jgi:predicted nucleic acid-binding protein
MGWLNLPVGSTIAVDSAPLIYLIEKTEPYASFLLPFFDLIAEAKIKAVTSSITLTEIFVKPLQEQRHDILNSFKKLLTAGNNFSIIPVTIDLAIKAASIRAQYGLRTPDAIQIDTAQQYAEYFLTNDIKLGKVPEVKTLIINELIKG